MSELQLVIVWVVQQVGLFPIMVVLIGIGVALVVAPLFIRAPKKVVTLGFGYDGKPGGRFVGSQYSSEEADWDGRISQ